MINIKEKFISDDVKKIKDYLAKKYKKYLVEDDIEPNYIAANFRIVTEIYKTRTLFFISYYYFIADHSPLIEIGLSSSENKVNPNTKANKTALEFIKEFAIKEKFTNPQFRKFFATTEVEASTAGMKKADILIGKYIKEINRIGKKGSRVW